MRDGQAQWAVGVPAPRPHPHLQPQPCKAVPFINHWFPVFEIPVGESSCYQAERNLGRWVREKGLIKRFFWIFFFQYASIETHTDCSCELIEVSKQ